MQVAIDKEVIMNRLMVKRHNTVANCTAERKTAISQARSIPEWAVLPYLNDLYALACTTDQKRVTFTDLVRLGMKTKCAAPVFVLNDDQRATANCSWSLGFLCTSGNSVRLVRLATACNALSQVLMMAARMAPTKIATRTGCRCSSASIGITAIS